MRATLILLALAGCDFDGSCETVQQTGPGITGLVTYMLGDGTRLEADLGTRTFTDTRSDGFDVVGKLKDAWGIERSFTVRVLATEPGTYDLATLPATLCMVRQSGGSDVCSALTGTLELRAHARDCYWHSSGIGTCADTLDFTLAGRSDWETTLFTIDSEMFTEGAWVDDPDGCAD